MTSSEPPENSSPVSDTSQKLQAEPSKPVTIRLSRRQQKREISRAHLHVTRAMEYISTLWSSNNDRVDVIQKAFEAMHLSLSDVKKCIEIMALDVYGMDVDKMERRRA